MRAAEKLLVDLFGELVGLVLEAVDVDLALAEAAAFVLFVVVVPQLSAARRDGAEEAFAAILLLLLLTVGLARERGRLSSSGRL